MFSFSNVKLYKIRISPNFHEQFTVITFGLGSLVFKHISTITNQSWFSPNRSSYSKGRLTVNEINIRFCVWKVRASYSYNILQDSIDSLPERHCCHSSIQSEAWVKATKCIFSKFPFFGRLIEFFFFWCLACF